MKKVKKYDIWLVDLNPVKGSEQSGIRPCVILQNDLFFEYQKTTLIAPITSQFKQGKCIIGLNDYHSYGLELPSSLLVFQLRTIDKNRCIKKIGSIDDEKTRKQINTSLLLTLDTNDDFLHKV
ncbi:type II toxin-antitoxin system PemK/MazF family toxin [Candidatus Gracilibacteria bacterium]|nr:type II toxin-antitoxin system PemK/MazF family toxin [Candidatus Gracilibacteria bacterium]